MNLAVELDPDVPLGMLEPPASRDDLAEQLELEAPERNSLPVLEAARETGSSAPLAPDYATQLSGAPNFRSRGDWDVRGTVLPQAVSIATLEAAERTRLALGTKAKRRRSAAHVNR